MRRWSQTWMTPQAASLLGAAALQAEVVALATLEVAAVAALSMEIAAWPLKDEAAEARSLKEVAAAAEEALPLGLAAMGPSALIGVLLQLGTVLRLWTYAIGLNGCWLKFALDWRSLHHERSRCPLRRRQG